jgi:carboxymethylenebutenolidase
MKKIILLLLFFPVFSFAQRGSCCKISATEKFSQMASNETFASAHANPIPFKMVSEKGKMVFYECSDGNQANAYEIRSEVASNKWLFVFHEWWGLNDYIKQEAERYATDLPNVNVIAIDLYDGQLAEKTEEAQDLMKKMSDDRSRSIINGAINYIGNKPVIATLGWCMGGAWSLQASILAGKNAVGCVMYYGMPETDITRLKTLNCDVLGIFGTKDTHISPAVVKTFEKNMKDAGEKLTVKNYDAVHAFANPSNPNFDRTATADARKLTLEFLTTRLK